MYTAQNIPMHPHISMCIYISLHIPDFVVFYLQVAAAFASAKARLARLTSPCKGLGLRIEGSGLRIEASGLRVSGLRLRVQVSSV